MKKTILPPQRLLQNRLDDAFQFWPVLVWAAKNQQTMTYKDLYELTGVHWHEGNKMSRSLDIIYRYCEENLNCYLTVLVVTQGTGKPGGRSFVPDNAVDKARQDVFALAKGKDKKTVLTNPGLVNLQQFIEEWNEKYFGR